MKSKLGSVAMAVAAILLLVVAAMGFARPGAAATLDPAVLTTADVSGCIQQPCSTDGQSASQPNGTLLSAFGDSYNITSFDPSLQVSGVSTPGELAIDNSVATLLASGFPQPALSGQCSSAVGGGCISAGTLLYEFEIVPTTGTSSTVSVGVSATGTMSVNTSGDSQTSNSDLQFILGTGPGQDLIDDLANINFGAGCNAGLSPPCSATDDSVSQGNAFVSTPGVDGATLTAPGSTNMFSGIDESGTYQLDTNTIYQIDMVMSLNLSGGSGSGSIDPILTVPEGYELVLSPGVGNGVTATPEPATWPLLGAGLAILAAVNRKRFRRAQR